MSTVSSESQSMTGNGSVFFELNGDKFTFAVLGTFGGGTLVLETAQVNYDQVNVTRAVWEADTTTYWEAVTINGSAYSITATDISEYCDNPMRFVRFRLTGATSPSITVVLNRVRQL